MKMIYPILNIVFLCLFISSPVFSQKAVRKAMEEAIKEDRKDEKEGKYYVAIFSGKKIVKLEDVEKYCGNKYRIRNVEAERKGIYGDVVNVVRSFEFLDAAVARKKEIAEAKVREEDEAKEKIRRAKARKEFAAVKKAKKEKERLEAIVAKEEEERIENELLATAKAKPVIVNENQQVFSQIQKVKKDFNNYGYNFKIGNPTRLPEKLYLVKSKLDPKFIIYVVPSGILYLTTVSDKTGQDVTFQAYNATRNNKPCYYLHGFNTGTEKDEHFLIESDVTMSVVTNLTIDPDKPIIMHHSTREGFENLLGTRDLSFFYSGDEYPKGTKLSGGIWGVTRVDMKKDFYYIIDNKFSYSKDLSCYDKCVSCDFFGGKSNNEVDVKDISLYCQGKLMATYKIVENDACNRTYYTIDATSSSGYQKEVEAIIGLVMSKMRYCDEDEEYFTKD